MSSWKAVAVATSVLLLASCSAEPKEQPRELPVAYASISETARIRSLSQSDLKILESPIAVADLLPVVVVGRVVAVHEGPVFYSTGMSDYYAFVEVQPEEILKNEEDAPAKSIYVLVEAGGAVTDEEGVEKPLKKGESYSRLTDNELSRGFPVGVNATVMGYYTTLDAPVEGAVTISRGSSVPEGTLVLRPDPQGFILEGENGTAVNTQSEQENIEVGAWETGNDAFLEIVESLEEELAPSDNQQ